MKKIWLVSLCGVSAIVAGTVFLLMRPTTVTDTKPLVVSGRMIDTSSFFIGTDNGLYKIAAQVSKVLDQPVMKTIAFSNHEIWVLTRNDIFYSSDGYHFQEKNKGITKKVLKIVSKGKTNITQENESLKDLAIDPFDHHNLITGSIHGVYVSTNSGDSWTFHPSNAQTNGIKSVGIYSWNHQIHLFFGHPYKGLYHQILGQDKWDIISSDGQEGRSHLTSFRGEISSIAIIPNQDKTLPPNILAVQNFDPVIFKVDLKKHIFKTIYTLKRTQAVELIESLQQQNNGNFLFVNNHGVTIYNPQKNNTWTLPKISHFIYQFLQTHKTTVNSISALVDSKPLYNISELWMLQKRDQKTTQSLASDKRGVYVQTDVLNSEKRFPVLLALLKNLHMNMIVVDMKDDYGNLRFHTTNPLLLREGHVFSPINMKNFKMLKDQNIYVVARIPVFKDQVLYHYNKDEYAIQDENTHQPWRGIKKSKSGKTSLIKEFWVDPYNEHIWEYNITIAKELLQQGFDEIQFDYFRFPTDGVNLSHAVFPSRPEGMDKEGALISFLRYARSQINAPISLDIYGANGWLRTGSMTGQDVETLSLYADVICPMYYPSHFPNSFLNTPPYEDRPYRIYLIGSYRNAYIARNRSIIRPYVQAFNLTKNPYDETYYGPNYINKELQGLHDSIDLGYTFWNSSTKYSILYGTVLNKTK